MIYDEVLSKENFDKLWAINPNFVNASQNYNSTYNLLVHIVKYPKLTHDGKRTDFDLIYKRYKQYHHVKSLINEGTETKYIKKENMIKCIFDYLWDNMHLTETKLPETGKHFYFWGANTPDEINNKFKTFSKLCEKT